MYCPVLGQFGKYLEDRFWSHVLDAQAAYACMPAALTRPDDP